MPAPLSCDIKVEGGAVDEDVPTILKMNFFEDLVKSKNYTCVKQKLVKSKNWTCVKQRLVEPQAVLVTDRSPALKPLLSTSCICMQPTCS